MPKREATEKDPCLPYSPLGDGHSAMPRRCGWRLPGAQSSRVTPPLLSCLGRSYFPIWYFSSKQQYHLGKPPQLHLECFCLSSWYPDSACTSSAQATSPSRICHHLQLAGRALAKGETWTGIKKGFESSQKGDGGGRRPVKVAQNSRVEQSVPVAARPSRYPVLLEPAPPSGLCSCLAANTSTGARTANERH